MTKINIKDRQVVTNDLFNYLNEHEDEIDQICRKRDFVFTVCSTIKEENGEKRPVYYSLLWTNVYSPENIESITADLVNAHKQLIEYTKKAVLAAETKKKQEEERKKLERRRKIEIEDLRKVLTNPHFTGISGPVEEVPDGRGGVFVRTSYISPEFLRDMLNAYLEKYDHNENTESVAPAAAQEKAGK